MPRTRKVGTHVVKEILPDMRTDGQNPASAQGAGGDAGADWQRRVMKGCSERVTGAEAWVKGSQQCRWEGGQGRGSQAEEERGRGLGGRAQGMRAIDAAGEACRGLNLIQNSAGATGSLQLKRPDLFIYQISNVRDQEDTLV